MALPLTVTADRASLANGDDDRSHKRPVTVDPGTLLSVLLDDAQPDAGRSGWSWVAVVDSEITAVWSDDTRTLMLVPDCVVTAENCPRTIFYRCYWQIDPHWLHARLSEGAAADFTPLHREYAPIARAKQEEAHRRREQEVSARYLSPECVTAIESLGGVVDLHNDTLFRFDLLGARWTVERSDSMSTVRVNDDDLASLRPMDVAERWLVAAAGAEARTARGQRPITRPWRLRTARLRPMPTGVDGVPRWEAIDGWHVARPRGDRAVEAYRAIRARSLSRITALMTRR